MFRVGKMANHIYSEPYFSFENDIMNSSRIQMEF